MTLEEFGAKLSAEREKKGVSLDDVSNRLKISVRMLRALEQGDRENFPHIAYARGFLRSYANYLGLSQEEISDALGSISPLTNEVAFVALSENQRNRQVLSPLLIQICAFALILSLVGGMGYLVWHSGWASSAYNWVMEKTQNFRKGNDSSGRKESQSIAPLSSSLDEDTLLPKNETSVPKTPSYSSVGPSGLPDNRAETLGREALPAGAEAGTRDATMPTDTHQVVMIATEDCWVHSTADRIDTRQFSLKKGDTFALSFREKLEVKLGNAGGVRFRYNGQEIPPMGKPGQVKTVLFPLGTNE